MESPYKVKHYSPVKKIPVAYDPYWNPTEWEDIEADIYKESKQGEKDLGEYLHNIHVGEGLLAQIKPDNSIYDKIEAYGGLKKWLIDKIQEIYPYQEEWLIEALGLKEG